MFVTEYSCKQTQTHYWVNSHKHQQNMDIDDHRIHNNRDVKYKESLVGKVIDDK